MSNLSIIDNYINNGYVKNESFVVTTKSYFQESYVKDPNSYIVLGEDIGGDGKIYNDNIILVVDEKLNEVEIISSFNFEKNQYSYQEFCNKIQKSIKFIIELQNKEKIAKEFSITLSVNSKNNQLVEFVNINIIDEILDILSKNKIENFNKLNLKIHDRVWNEDLLEHEINSNNSGRNIVKNYNIKYKELNLINTHTEKDSSLTLFGIDLLNYVDKKFENPEINSLTVNCSEYLGHFTIPSQEISVNTKIRKFIINKGRLSSSKSLFNFKFNQLFDLSVPNPMGEDIEYHNFSSLISTRSNQVTINSIKNILNGFIQNNKSKNYESKNYGCKQLEFFKDEKSYFYYEAIDEILNNETKCNIISVKGNENELNSWLRQGTIKSIAEPVDVKELKTALDNFKNDLDNFKNDIATSNHYRDLVKNNPNLFKSSGSKFIL